MGGKGGGRGALAEESERVWPHSFSAAPTNLIHLKTEKKSCLSAKLRSRLRLKFNRKRRRSVVEHQPGEKKVVVEEEVVERRSWHFTSVKRNKGG